MKRAHCIPGAVLLGIAFLLSLLTAISLPYVREFDIARVTFQGNTAKASSGDAREARLGIWGYCYESAKSSEWLCVNTGHAYTFAVQTPTASVTIGSSWTRGLVIHAIATIVTFVALVMSLIPNVFAMLLGALTAWLAALLTLIAFFCDIALFAYFKNKMNDIGDAQPSTNPGPGFWMTFVTFFLLCFAGCAVLFGRKKERRLRGDDYVVNTRRPFYHKFRRGVY